MSDGSEESERAGVDYGFRKPCSCGTLSACVYRCEECEQDLANSERTVRVSVTGGAA